MLCNYSVSLILRAFLINMPEYMQLALTQCFIVQVQVSQISSTDQVTYFKYFLINMPEDAPCTDPNFLLNVSKISNIFSDWVKYVFQIFLDQHARRCSLR